MKVFSVENLWAVEEMGGMLASFQLALKALKETIGADPKAITEDETKQMIDICNTLAGGLAEMHRDTIGFAKWLEVIRLSTDTN